MFLYTNVSFIDTTLAITKTIVPLLGKRPASPCTEIEDDGVRAAKKMKFNAEVPMQNVKLAQDGNQIYVKNQSNQSKKPFQS